MSKLNVGVGAEFPVDSADPEPADDARYDECAGYRRHGRFRGYGRHRHGPMFFAVPLVLIAFIALISLAISYPGVILALIAVAAFGFAMRHHHRHDRDGWYPDRRDDWRERPDAGPQPDAPPPGTTARS